MSIDFEGLNKNPLNMAFCSNLFGSDVPNKACQPNIQKKILSILYSMNLALLGLPEVLLTEEIVQCLWHTQLSIGLCQVET